MRERPEKRPIILKNCRILSMKPGQKPVQGDMLMENGLITGIGRFEASQSDTLSLEGHIVCPGFVQPYSYLSRFVFRGAGIRINGQNGLSPEAARVSALVAGMELIACGVTTCMAVEDASVAPAVAEAMGMLGLRGYLGCAPETDDAEAAIEALRESFQGVEAAAIKTGAMIRPAVALLRQGRKVGCLLRQLASLATENDAPFILGASRNPQGVDAALKALLDSGFPGRLIHLMDALPAKQAMILRAGEHNVRMTFSPMSDLSTWATPRTLLESMTAGPSVMLTADGHSDNGNFDLFSQMRLLHGMAEMQEYNGFSPEEIVAMATIGGARALGLERELGSLETGKRADLVILKPGVFHAGFEIDPFSALVRACTPANVAMVLIGGEFIFRNGRFFCVGKEEIADKAALLLDSFRIRAGGGTVS